MKKLYEINYLDLRKNKKYEEIIGKVLKECFRVESLLDYGLIISVTLTTPGNIKELNNRYRKINEETDVLSFPMFEKDELMNKIQKHNFLEIEILGDMIISIERVKKQAIEYGHSFERELSYMVVHSFYHLLGYDHIKEEDNAIMRQKEEYVLDRLNIIRGK